MQKLQLSIPEPCHENWDRMTPTQQGRFCNACAKEVVDFSEMSDTEVLNYFNKNITGKVCGRTYPDQLERVIQAPAKPKGKLFRYWNYAAALFLFFAKVNTAKAQVKDTVVTTALPFRLGKIAAQKPEIKERIIKGTVTDNKGAPIAGASVVLTGLNIGILTDVQGYFKIKVPANATTCQVSAVGYSTKVINISAAPEYNVVIQLREMMTGEVITVKPRNIDNENTDFGAYNHIITFKVHDNKTLLPVANVQVSVMQEGKQKKYSTDKNGNCKIRNIDESKSYDFEFSAAGYENTITSIRGADLYKRKVQQDVFLLQEPQSPEYKKLDPVTVTTAGIISCSRVTMGYMSTSTVIRINVLQDIKAATITAFNDSLKIYPNPVLKGNSFRMALHLKNSGNYQMQISDIAGNVLAVQQFATVSNEHIQEIQADKRWASGMYIMRLFDNKNKLVNKRNFQVQ